MARVPGENPLRLFVVEPMAVMVSGETDVPPYKSLYDGTGFDPSVDTARITYTLVPFKLRDTVPTGEVTMSERVVNVLLVDEYASPVVVTVGVTFTVYFVLEVNSANVEFIAHAACDFIFFEVCCLYPMALVTTSVIVVLAGVRFTLLYPTSAVLDVTLEIVIVPDMVGDRRSTYNFVVQSPIMDHTYSQKA